MVFEPRRQQPHKVKSNNVHTQFTGLVYLFSRSSSCNVSCMLSIHNVKGPNVIMSCGTCCQLVVQYNYRRCSKIIRLPDVTEKLARALTDSVILSFDFLSTQEVGLFCVVPVAICSLPSPLPAFY